VGIDIAQREKERKQSMVCIICANRPKFYKISIEDLGGGERNDRREVEK